MHDLISYHRPDEPCVKPAFFVRRQVTVARPAPYAENAAGSHRGSVSLNFDVSQ